MDILMEEFLVLIAACVGYLAVLLTYNFVGGGKKKAKRQ